MLPLYPQYCSSTTGSVFDRTSQALQRWRWLPETRFVNDYFDDAGYIDALTAQIQDHWAAAGERSHLLLSYHGIPAVYVAEGDPYQVQAESTTRAGRRAARVSPRTNSRIVTNRASARWSGCSLIRRMCSRPWPQRGVRKLTIVSPSFAVDCLETWRRWRSNIGDKFLELGGEKFGLVPALNDGDRHAETAGAHRQDATYRAGFDLGIRGPRC